MTAPGRYCLAICYCGDCPHYKPLPEPRAPKASTDDRQADTWADRTDTTWIDAL